MLLNLEDRIIRKHSTPPTDALDWRSRQKYLVMYSNAYGDARIPHNYNYAICFAGKKPGSFLICGARTNRHIEEKAVFAWAHLPSGPLATQMVSQRSGELFVEGEEEKFKGL